MSSTPSSDERKLQLLDLPPELLLHICSFTSFSSLAKLQRVSRSLHQLITSASEGLHRRLCFTTGFTDEAGAGASTAVNKHGTSGLGLDRLATSFDVEELQRVARAQRSMSGLFADVQTWKELARRRVTLDANWLKGSFQDRWIMVGNGPGGHGFFRFKLDVEPNLVVVSGVGGGYSVYDSSGALVWTCELPTSAYSHVECSNGYFTQMISEQGNRFLCWRRNDIASPESSLPAEVINTYTRRSEHHIPARPGYTPFAVIDSPGATNATKLRWPYHLGASAGDHRLYRYDLSAARMDAIDISPLWTPGDHYDPIIRYVEVLGEFCLVAGLESITFWHPERGLVGSFPPPTPSSLPRQWGHFRYAQLRPRWSAVHHDSKGHEGTGNLVATSDGDLEHGGKLMWTSRVGDVLAGASAEEIAESTVVLQTDAPIVQLAVENGRCAFITEAGDLSMLWLVNLRPFNTLEEFEADPPKPICIAYPIPTLTLSSRLELTSDEILLPASSVFAPGGPFHAGWLAVAELASRLSGQREDGLCGPMSWETLDGRVLKRYPSDGEDEQRLAEVAGAWVGLMNEVNAARGEWMGGTDAILAYSFGGM